MTLISNAATAIILSFSFQRVRSNDSWLERKLYVYYRIVCKCLEYHIGSSRRHRFSPCTAIVVGSPFLQNSNAQRQQRLAFNEFLQIRCILSKAFEITQWPQCRQCKRIGNGYKRNAFSTKLQSSTKICWNAWHTHTHTHTIDKPDSSNLHANFLVRHNFVPEMPFGLLFDVFCRSTRKFYEFICTLSGRYKYASWRFNYDALVVWMFSVTKCITRKSTSSIWNWRLLLPHICY